MQQTFNQNNLNHQNPSGHNCTQSLTKSHSYLLIETWLYVWRHRWSPVVCTASCCPDSQPRCSSAHPTVSWTPCSVNAFASRIGICGSRVALRLASSSSSSARSCSGDASRAWWPAASRSSWAVGARCDSIASAARTTAGTRAAARRPPRESSPRATRWPGHAGQQTQPRPSRAMSDSWHSVLRNHSKAHPEMSVLM